MSSIVIAGDTSGSITVAAPAVAGSGTVLTLPATTGTVLTTTGGVTPGTAGNVLTSNGTTWTSAAAGGGIGSGQTWTNVTSSRSMGTTYTNSTGKPILVLITFNGSGPGARHDVYIDSVNIAQCYATDYYSGSAATTHYQMGTFIVPNGSTYSDNTGNGSPSILLWFELR